MEITSEKIFVPLLEKLRYDPLEIEHTLYMFNHNCVGCVTLKCTVKMDTSHIGKAYLNGQELPECFFFDFAKATPQEATILGVKVRGFVDYGRTYTLTLEDFYTADGKKIEAVNLPFESCEKRKAAAGYEAHDEVALQAAREGIILLKNDENVLPLPKKSTLNLFGSGVGNFRISAIGAGRINPRYTMGLEEAAEAYGSFCVNRELADFYRVPNDGIPDLELMLRAKSLSDVAVVVITRGTGENVDNQPISGEYYLTEDEDQLLEAVSNVFKKTVVILNTGYPIHMEWMRKYNVKGVLYIGLAGQSAARALCEILSGEVNPSGRLTDTWTWDYYDIPSSADFYCPKQGESPVMADDTIWAETRYEEGIYVGYRYFESAGKDVAFDFGHGLSYSSFEKSTVSSFEEEKDGYKIKIKVSNTGKVPGKETAVLYAGLPGEIQEQPKKQLVAFGKTRELLPGESQEFTLLISKKLLATWGEEDNAWIMNAGTYIFYLGGSVNGARECFRMIQNMPTVIQRLKYRMPCPVQLEEMSIENGFLWPKGKFTGLLPDDKELSHKKPALMQRQGKRFERMSDEKITWNRLMEEPKLIDSFVAQMTNEELCRLNLMYCEDWGMEKKGAAGSLAPLKTYRLPEYVVCDGNCGLNLQKPNIGMPTSVVVCATWNTELAEVVGRIIGEEAVETGMSMVLATAMNIHRNPLNGRHPEYFSEDPLLAGRMAGHQIKGLHKAGISDSVKHVICNNCETARKRNHSLVGERAFREIYLRAFELLCDVEQPDSIMTSYNACNGSMTAENTVLLEGIFRDELSFDGFAMTDWGSYATVDIVTAVNAGISWLTPGEKDGSMVKQLLDAVESGQIRREVIQENIYRMLKTILKRKLEGTCR